MELITHETTYSLRVLGYTVASWTVTAGVPFHEPPIYKVELVDRGPTWVHVIKAVRELCEGLGLREAKELVDKSAEEVVLIKSGIGEDEMKNFVTKVEAAKGKVRITRL